MRQYKIEDEEIATTDKVWMGIDAHKKTLHVTVLDEQGDVVLSESVPHRHAHVVGLVKRFENTEIVAVYEAGPTGYKLREWLEELGCTATMCPPTHVRQKRGGKHIKTDERDSFDLAEQARANMLPSVHALDTETYAQREVERTRGQLVKHRSQLKNQIKSKLLYHQLRAPDDLKTRWSKAYIDWLKQGPSEHQELNVCIQSMVSLLESLDAQIKSLDAQLRKMQKSEKWAEKAQRLRSVPGIGQLTAMLILLELGDVSRFERCEELASWLGLVPTEWSSGEGQRKGSITRAGNRRLRTALVEASWMLIRKDKAMGATYERIKAKGGTGVAIVAVARRLALAIRAMLRDERDYDYQPASN